MSTEITSTIEPPAPQATAAVNAYELSGVTRLYTRGEVTVQALRGIDLKVPRGEYVVVEGPSGSGKSTLLQLMGMLDTPTSGSIRCGGEEVSQLAEAELAELRLRKIGFIFQQFNLIPTLTARQNIEIAMFPSGVGKAAAKARADELLTRVGLGARADHFPGQLSGGEQQRVAIARALANSPEILLADEPTGNLDGATSQEILGLIKELWRQGLTVVLITHDRSIAADATRSLFLRDGQLQAAAGESAQEILRNSSG